MQTFGLLLVYLLPGTRPKSRLRGVITSQQRAELRAIIKLQASKVDEVYAFLNIAGTNCHKHTSKVIDIVKEQSALIEKQTSDIAVLQTLLTKNGSRI